MPGQFRPHESAHPVATGSSNNESCGRLYALVDAAARRLQTADVVAAVKFRTGGAVDDPVREHHVIDRASAAAAGKNIDPDYVAAVFRDQIDATNAIEHFRFAEWRLAPGAAPVSAPDLAQIRTVIDRLDQILVDEIATQWDSLHSAACGTYVDEARNSVALARRLDDFSRRALIYATHSYCGVTDSA
ncbi:chorismate mutase [Mycobacterium simiae]|uniref:chorismate mutase n=1 Tax=Mycobacterium simiae TaxID=1784 RepID=UPI002620A8EC|nr:chorismate mutase [Mycobacterium simiae]